MFQPSKLDAFAPAMVECAQHNCARRRDGGAPAKIRLRNETAPQPRAADGVAVPHHP